MAPLIFCISSKGKIQKKLDGLISRQSNGTRLLFRINRG